MHVKTAQASAAALGLSALLLFGCKSREDAALEQARQQAAATGQTQQVVSVDRNGTTTTTTVQPPVPGQTGQSVTTTVTPAGNALASTSPSSSASSSAAPSGRASGYGTSAGVPVSSPGVAPQQAVSQPQTATPGGAPIVRPADVSIPAGTSLAIRINQHISVKTTRAGDHFDGEVVEPIPDVNNRVVVPRGTPVGGIIDASHRRGHFKGASVLELRLTTMTLNGTRYPLDTRDLTRSKKGKGKRSAAFIGGGTGLGMLIGGVATGGVGLLVGGLAGAGAGTAVAGLTGNRDIEIPSESIVRFRLADDLVVRPI